MYSTALIGWWIWRLRLEIGSSLSKVISRALTAYALTTNGE
jgi:hypothetical protein